MTDYSDTSDSKSKSRKIATAYRVVAASTKAASTNFYYAFATLPADKRNAVYAGYSFCRLADDIVDHGIYGKRTGEALDALQNKLIEASKGDCVKTNSFQPDLAAPELWQALSHTLKKFPINHQHLIDVVEGCRMDLNGTTYDTWEQLIQYCKRVASATGLALIEVFGYEDNKAVEYAVDLGIALQLTNILRDITEDLEIGRVYLPRTEMDAFGVSLTDLREKRVTPSYVRFMQFQVKRARKYLESGIRLFPLLDDQSRQCPQIMVHVYQLLLDRIEKNNFDTLNRKTSLSRWQKFKLIARIWLRIPKVRLS
ncbi:MAG: squalene/phytoene synthase family protein [SAR202 cluster bacterium]|nr:squalene/phytoene synthase family protein [SAR202 cluster bacterium]|tara:strand:- start:1329 stop:2264 length:936 start_codon:yes stop_codon:yes gene_type:complete